MKFDFKFFLHNTASSVISFGWHFRETNLFFRKSEFKETFFREVLVLRQPYTKNLATGEMHNGCFLARFLNKTCSATYFCGRL